NAVIPTAALTIRAAIQRRLLFFIMLTPASVSMRNEIGPLQKNGAPSAPNNVYEPRQRLADLREGSGGRCLPQLLADRRRPDIPSAFGFASRQRLDIIRRQ